MVHGVRIGISTCGRSETAHRFAVLRDDAGRNANEVAFCRNVLHDDRASADFHVVAEHDRAEHARVHADGYVAAGVGWRLPCEARAAQRNA